MLLQRGGAGTIPPPGFAPPSWTSLTKIWDAAPKQICPTVTLGPATVSLGHDDLEADDIDPVKCLKVDRHEFGWDNESPKRDKYVEEFCIEWRPVTNGQFYDFYVSGGQEKVKLPASWVEFEGETCVCTCLQPWSVSWLNPDTGSYYVRSRAYESGLELACRNFVQ